MNLDSVTQRMGMGSMILGAFVVIMGFGGAMIAWKSEQLLKFVYIVPVVFLFLAIAAFLLILLHYSVVLQRTIPGIPVGALGLPEGSVRAFLAIGLLALVAVFGAFLYFESKGGSFPEAGLLQTDNLADTRAVLGDRFILIRDPEQTDKATAKYVHDHRAEIEKTVKAKTDHDAASAKAKQEGKEAPPLPEELKKPWPTERTVYRVVSTTLDTSRGDLAKQLLVMITTLLTTVVGFYFGSRSGETTPPPGDMERRATAQRELRTAYDKAEVAPLQEGLDRLATAAAALVDTAAKAKAESAVKALREKLAKASQDLETANAALGDADIKTADLETQRKNAVDASAVVASVKLALDTAKDDVTKLP